MWNLFILRMLLYNKITGKWAEEEKAFRMTADQDLSDGMLLFNLFPLYLFYLDFFFLVLLTYQVNTCKIH